MKALRQLLRPIFPHVCEICGQSEAGPEQSFICAPCRERPEAIIPMEPPLCCKCGLGFQGAITTNFQCANCADLKLHFTYARAAVEYKGLIKEIIRRYKYDRNEWYETFLAETLLDSIRAEFPLDPVDFIVPVPLHKSRQQARGFNQSERLAARLAKALDKPTANLLERTLDTDSQARLDRDDREANVKKAFAYAGPRLRSQRILLIDDVLTTGLTASACARQLILHGASTVRVWTVARGGLS